MRIQPATMPLSPSARPAKVALGMRLKIVLEWGRIVVRERLKPIATVSPPTTPKIGMAKEFKSQEPYCGVCTMRNDQRAVDHE